METKENIIKLEAVDSTNSYAMKLFADVTIFDFAVIIANEQTKGRGQHENFWESEKLLNLTFSIVLRPKLLKARNHFALSQAVSLGVADFVQLYVDNVSVKWTNDIYVNNDKIAGILIENSITGENITFSVVGIGININQLIFKSNAPNPISLKMLTGNTYDLDECLNLLLKSIKNRIQQLYSSQLSQLNNDYICQLYRINIFHCYFAKNKFFFGKITGITNFGRLIIKKLDGSTIEFDFKEVNFVN